jgi:SAM-dependent methyltransferase
VTDWTDVAAWYDVLNPWGESDDFYLDVVLGAGRVLDVGCGTGTLLHRAHAEGHAGRLCGLDPDPAMLAVARTKAADGVEWVDGDAASATWRAEFELATMTGHAFQCLISDDDLSASLRAIGTALVPGGRFSFETRNPAARAWERWHGASFQARNPDGDVVTVSYEVRDVTGDVIRLTETLAGQWWPEPRTEAASLRFIDPDVLAALVAEAGFVIEERYGDWRRGPLTAASDEVITIARLG